MKRKTKTAEAAESIRELQGRQEDARAPACTRLGKDIRLSFAVLGEEGLLLGVVSAFQFVMVKQHTGRAGANVGTEATKDKLNRIPCRKT